MAGNFPYMRNQNLDPYAFRITGPNETLAPINIDQQVLADKGIETFRFTNPARCWVWLRGVPDAMLGTWGYADIAGKGLLYPPGAVEVMKTQYPENIAVVAADFPDVPASGSDGMYLFPNRYCYIAYGGGF